MAARAWIMLLAGAAALGSTALAAPPVAKPFTQADYAALAKLPDWTGVWQPDWKALFADRGAHKNEPDLMPAAAAALAKYNAEKKAGEHLQTDAANCVPPGMPQIMEMPYPIEFLYTPGRVTLAAETYSQVRRIYTDGEPLPDDPDPFFNGHSIGHWEGDTLVVDTNGLNPETSVVEGVHPTDKTLIHETFHLDKPDLLVDTITVTDPTVFAKPYQIKIPYMRKRDWRIREYVCQENNHDASDPFGRPSMQLSDPKNDQK